jgi:hypothetical protein
VEVEHGPPANRRGGHRHPIISSAGAMGIVLMDDTG